VSFAPEAIHEAVNELDVEIPVEFRGHRADQIFESLLKERIIKARLITGVRIAEVSFRGRFAFGRAEDEVDFRNLFENEIGQRRRVRVVGGAHLNPKADALVVLVRQIKDELYVLGELEMSRTRLHLWSRTGVGQ